MICEPGDVVVVPFPFSDLPVSKVRPALVISAARANEEEGETVMVMITTAAASKRPGDMALVDWAEAGLRTPCVMRLRVFSLDNRIIARRIGRLGSRDRSKAAAAVRSLIAI